MIRLSFIVPFYNVEPYIEECIRSLYNQDIPMEEYEVICVDDCSLDGSRAIVERLQKEYPTLKLLIHTENKRQGGARNTGMKVAQGRYIWFVDSDDYIKPNCIESMLRKAEDDNLDLLKFYGSFSSKNQLRRLVCSNEVTTGSELIFSVEWARPILDRCNSAVMQVIRREYLLQHQITFTECVQYEDDDYGYQLYAYANRAFLIADEPYIIRRTPNSTTRRRHDLRRVQDIYAQALRMAVLDPILTKQDPRWHAMVAECINDCINNCVFQMLKTCPIQEQLLFWIRYRKQSWKLKPYLSRKSFIKLSSFLAWRLLQK